MIKYIIETGPNQPYTVRVAGKIIGDRPTYRKACALARKGAKGCI